MPRENVGLGEYCCWFPAYFTYPGQSRLWRNVAFLQIYIMEFAMAVLKFRPPPATLSSFLKLGLGLLFPKYYLIFHSEFP